MSKIPSVAKTKSLPQSNAASEAHEKLLTMTWKKLDALVASLFGVSPAARPLAIEAAKKAYRARMGALAAKADTYRTKAGDTSEVPVVTLQGLAQRLRAHADYELNLIDETCFSAKVTRRELEHPLYLTKRSGIASREELAGFVDIVCNVDIPTHLSVFCDPQVDGRWHEESLDSFFRGRSVVDVEIEADELNSLELPTPTWLMGRTFPQLWIDVRPTDTPIGQLIRDLKALREFAGNAETRLLVVVDAIDDGKRAMLKHEDILTVTHQELEQL